MTPVRSCAALLVFFASSAAAQPGCIPSGETDIQKYFVAADATDRVTFETGLSSFTVVSSRNGAADVTYTTPTVTEIDSTTMPGLYAITVDEDTTIGSGNDYEPYAMRITHASMVPVTLETCIVRSKITLGNTLTVDSEGDANGNVTEFGGTDGTFATAGIPSVNTTRVGNTTQTARDLGSSVLLSPGTGTGQVQLTSGQLQVQSGTASGQIDLSSGQVRLQPVQTGTTIPTVTTLTNAPADSSGTTTLLTRVGTPPDVGSGASLAGNLEDMRDNGTAAFDRATDSQQAIRDRGDAAWTTGASPVAIAKALGVQYTFVDGAPASQTEFDIDNVPTDDAQLAGWAIYLEDAGDVNAYSFRKVISVDMGTITIDSAPDFTLAADDIVSIMPAYLADLVRIDTSDLFDVDSGETAGSAVAGSVVAEVVNAQAQQNLLDTAFLHCEINTANFAGSSTTLACILTDNEGAEVDLADSKLTGLEVRVLSGAQRHEGRFINATIWDDTNDELRITVSRAFPATLADGVVAIIR